MDISGLAAKAASKRTGHSNGSSSQWYQHLFVTRTACFKTYPLNIQPIFNRDSEMNGGGGAELTGLKKIL